jgi:hypothetical protein
MFDYVLTGVLQPFQRLNFSLNIDSDSDFLIERAFSNEDGSFRFQALDTTSSYQWFSDRMRMENFFGTAQYPNTFPTPIAVKRSSQLQFDIEDLSGAVNNFELVFDGYRIEEDIQLTKSRYFAYVKDFDLGPLARTQDTLTTNSDTSFVANRLIGYVDKDYVTKLKISLSSLAGRNLFSQFTTFENIFGTALRPNTLLHPLTLDKNSIVKYDIQNSEALPHTVQLVMDGVKVWS